MSRLCESTRRAWQRAKSAFAAFVARRDPAEWFIALTLMGLFVFLLRCLIDGESALTGVLFRGGEDLFMDFFHPVRDAASGVGVYTIYGSIYPPLSNAVLFLISRVMPVGYLALPKEAAAEWKNYPAAILCFVCFAVLSWLVLALLLGRGPWRGGKKALFLAAALCSFPMLFLLERGNTMPLCLAAMLVYVQNYESENKAAREGALVALAVATALKFYPVLLGLTLLADRRFRDAAHAAIYGLFCLFLPSAFYHGPISVFWAIRYTLGFSRAQTALSTEFMAQNGIPLRLGGAALICFYILLAVFAVVYAAAERKPWKSWMVAASVTVTMPSIFSSYNWLLYLPAMFLFFATEKLRGRNLLYFFFLTIPFFTYPPRPWQDGILVTCLIGLFALHIFDAAQNWRRLLRERKAKKASAENEIGA